MPDIDLNDFYLDDDTDFTILSEEELDEEEELASVFEDLMDTRLSPREEPALSLDEILQSKKELKRRRL